MYKDGDHDEMTTSDYRLAFQLFNSEVPEIYQVKDYSGLNDAFKVYNELFDLGRSPQEVEESYSITSEHREVICKAIRNNKRLNELTYKYTFIYGFDRYSGPETEKKFSSLVYQIIFLLLNKDLLDEKQVISYLTVNYLFDALKMYQYSFNQYNYIIEELDYTEEEVLLFFDKIQDSEDLENYFEQYHQK